ncbi:MAG: Gldg family protein [Firmicutes bacterium]|nr:Gldg family protein [Bacillota bacterium]
MNDKKSKAVRYRKLRYGSFAAAFTVVCVALVIIINAIFSAFSNKYMWYWDMTKYQVYGLTDASRMLLEQYKGLDGFEIKIIFCKPEDELADNYYSNMIYNCAKQYAEEFDFIDLEFYDVVTHPGLVDKYLTTSISTIKSTNVIITNGTESRVYTNDSFFTFDSDTGNIFAFNGEYKITSAIIQMDGIHPIAYFVKGHGEQTEGSVMYSLFSDAGFDVRTIDLSRENIDPSAKLLVINNPAYDYMGSKGTINEIAKIDTFLDNFGNLMVFRDATDNTFPELDEFLSEWGIQFENAIIRDFENSLSVDGTEIVAEYVTEGTGASLHSTLRDRDDPPKVIVNRARPIKLLFEEHNGRQTSAVLTTSSKKTAQAFYYDTEKTEPENGIYNLMTITCDYRYIDNEPHYSYVLAAGTSAFADDAYIGSGAYGNRDIIYTAMKNFCRKTVPVDINFKMFDDESLDITTAEATRWTVIYTVFLPAAVFVIAVVVFVRRRNL